MVSPRNYSWRGILIRLRSTESLQLYTETNPRYPPSDGAGQSVDYYCSTFDQLFLFNSNRIFHPSTLTFVNQSNRA